MQHLNWYTLAAVEATLNLQLAGGRWQDAFTQERDELVVVFRTQLGHPYFLRVCCRADIQYVLPQPTFRRARANSVDLFAELADARFVRARLCPADRILALDFEGEKSLWLKMHGPRSNVLRSQGGKPVELFRQQLAEDMALTWPEGKGIQLPNSSEEFGSWLSERVGETDAEALRSLFPRFDKYFVWRFEELRANGNSAFESLQKVLTEAQSSTFHLVEEAQQPPGLLLFPIAHLPTRHTYTDVAEALGAFVGKWLGRQRSRSLYRSIQTALYKTLQAARHRLESAQSSLVHLDQSRSPEELGHLIMAHLHLIATGASQVTLPDFYAEGSPLLTIKLDERLSAQQNAERLYSKAKDSKKKRAYLVKRLAESEAHWDRVQNVYRQFANLNESGLRALEQFATEHGKLLKLGSREQSATAQDIPFRQYEYGGFTIWVGRNAKNNDELTLRYARKDDLWLHAKDVQGSHVVVRLPKGASLPNHVLEYAAGLAAWFSKAKGSGLVPVTYTPRKFVRKSKALAAGQVIVEREQVILVPPIAPVSDD
jgi:predicted ribosome quality control (RQC) complex YloA/Tae2 family protein